MANQYKVTEVKSGGDDWENNYGKYRPFLVRFEGQDNQVQINRKLKDGKAKEPKVGDELPGAIEIQANGVPLFKQDYSGGGGYSGGSKKDGPSEEYWAGKDKRISRQHSQEMSLMAIKMVVGDTPMDSEKLKAAIKAWSDWFDNDLPELPSA